MLLICIVVVHVCIVDGERVWRVGDVVKCCGGSCVCVRYVENQM